MRRLLSSVDYNDTPTRAENDKQLEARLSQRMRNTKPTAIATARLADESGRRTPGGRPIARDPVGRRRCSPHLCRTHARDKPLTHQTKHPATERKPHPPHICGCGAQKQQTNTTQQTTNKHTTIATHPTARSSQPLPSLNPQSHAAYHAAIKEDATRRPQKTQTKHTPLGETRQTTTHMHTRPTQTKAHLYLSLLAARPSALPRPERRTQASTSEARPTHTHATKRRHANAEKYRERGAENQRGRGSPPPPSLPPRLAARRRRGSLALALSRSLSLSRQRSRLAPRAAPLSQAATDTRATTRRARRRGPPPPRDQRETVPRSRRRVPTPAALGARA